jgi:hypothetical protein
LSFSSFLGVDFMILVIMTRISHYRFVCNVRVPTRSRADIAVSKDGFPLDRIVAGRQEGRAGRCLMTSEPCTLVPLHKKLIGSTSTSSFTPASAFGAFPSHPRT